MAEDRVYNQIELLEEAQRYKTSVGFLELLFEELNGSRKILLDGLGARLLTISFALTEELYGLDVNQGSIDRAEQFILTWEKYVGQEPFKTEFEFLHRKGLVPKFRRHYFYLSEHFPLSITHFDGELASELFLHLNPAEVGEILTHANRRLKPGGKFVFTVYPSGYADSLDNVFYNALGLEAGMDRDTLITDGIVDIKTLAQRLKQKQPDVFEANKDKYWLDLDRVRVFSEEEIKRLCDDSGFKIKTVSHLNGGMFYFAHRLAYVLVK